MTFFVTDKPTPVLNTPRFSEIYSGALPFDDQQLVRELEYIAFPKQTFKVVNEIKPNILHVTTSEYPSSASLFVDKRFGGIYAEETPFFQHKMPSKEVLIERLLSKQGLPYVWGGNWSNGIPEWECFYPPPAQISKFERAHWSFMGLDCSGLLYEATEGLTPRNTKELMTYGSEISLTEAQALDLILYPGHVIIILGPDEVIESCHWLGGVVISPLKKRVDMIRSPLVVRRFFQTRQDIA
jgi:cell wall-associated NlpC family hydrolase